MKQRITKEDLASLTAEQRQNLSSLWMPQVYDVAMAYVCKDVATDEYDEIEFVVGSVQVYGREIYVTDIRELANLQPDPETCEAPEKENKPEQSSTGSVLTDALVQVDSDTSFTTGMTDQVADPPEEPVREEMDKEWEEDGEELCDEDLEYNYVRPTVFSKKDCVPLLTIGQMIELLQKNHFSSCNFSLTIHTPEMGYELRKSNASWDPDEIYGPAELCDVLWDAVKRIL